MTETAENPTRLSGWRLAAAAAVAVLVLLAGAGAVLWHYRAPVAEGMVRDRLADLGLSDADLTVATLTPWKIEVHGLSLGADGAARLSNLTAEIAWPSWVRPEVARLVLDGLYLRAALKDGAATVSGLEKLRAGQGRGGALDLPEVLLTNAFIDLDLDGDTAAVNLARVRLSRAADGAVTFSDLAADLVHPQGQLSLSGGGKWDGGTSLALHLAVDGGEARLGSVAVTRISGPLSLSGDVGNPRAMDVSTELAFQGLRGPADLHGDGSAKLRMTGGRAALELVLADAGRGLDISVGAAANLMEDGLPVTLKADIAAPDLSRAGLAEGLTGRASLRLETAADATALRALPPASLPPVAVLLEASGVTYPGAEGPWKVMAKGQLVSEEGVIALRFAEDIQVTGSAFGGEAALSVAGVSLRLDPESLRPVHLGLAEATGILSDIKTAGAQVAGPLKVRVTPGKDGAVTLREGAFQAADLAFRFESPAATVKAGGRALTLRTAKAAGTARLTAQPSGRPAVKAEVAGLAAALPAADLDVHGLRLAAASRGGEDKAWGLQFGVAELVHPALEPLSAEGKGRWSPWKLTVEGTLRQKSSGLVAGFAVSRNNRDGAGEVRVDTLPLDLGKAGGIGVVTHVLAPFVKSLTGTLQVSAQAALGPKGLGPAAVTASLKNAGLSPAPSLLPPHLKGALAGLGSLVVEAEVPPDDPGAGSAVVTVAGGNLRLPKANATGIEGRLTFERLWPPRTPRGQELRVARIDAGLPVTDGRLVFRLDGADRIQVDRAEVSAVGGKVAAAGFTLGSGGTPATVPLEVTGLGLGALADQFEVAGLKADGVLDGRLPLVLGDTVAVKAGLLRSRHKGNLAFRSPARAPKERREKEDARLDLVLDILEDLRFDDISISLDGDLAKDVQAVVRLKGRNPKIQEGRPVDLTVHLSGNIGEAVRAEFQNFDLKGLTASGLPPAKGLGNTPGK